MKKSTFLALSVILIVSISSIYLIENTERDPFMNEITLASGKGSKERSNISAVVAKYIIPGEPLREAIYFLEERGFRVYKIKPRNSHEHAEEKIEYIGRHEVRRNLLVQVQTVVVIDTDGEKVIKATGKIHLTGL